MTEYILAAGDSPARSIGSVIGMLIIPLAGLALLIVGLANRSKSKRQNAQPAFPQHQQPYAGAVPQYGQQPPTYGQQPPVYGQPQFGQNQPVGSQFVNPAQRYGVPPEAAAGQSQPAQGQPQYGQPQQWQTPKKTKGTALIVIGALLLGVGLLGVLARVAAIATSDTSSARENNFPGTFEVGGCTDSDSMGQVDFSDLSPVVCGTEHAVFEYAAETDDAGKCPDGQPIGSTGYGTIGTVDGGWCFALSLIEGECYSVSGVATIEPTSCSSQEPNVVKILKRVDGDTDAEKACGTPTGGLVFPQPPRVFCPAIVQ